MENYYYVSNTKEQTSFGPFETELDVQVFIEAYKKMPLTALKIERVEEDEDGTVQVEVVPLSYWGK